MWAIENQPQKREWIVENWAPKKLFGDIVKVAETMLEHDYISGEPQSVDPVFFVIGGTSCKDASRLSCHHKTRREAVKEGVGSTGRTFLAFMNIAEALKVKRIFLENVFSLKDQPCTDYDVANDAEGRASETTRRSNFEHVQAKCNALGMLFCSVDFDARTVGLPVRRRRIYMEGRAATDRTTDAMREAEVRLQASFSRTFEGVLRHVQPVDLDSILLPEYETMVEDWLLPKMGSRVTRAADSMMAWPDLHEPLWSAMPHRHEKRLHEEALRENPFFLSLCERQRDVLLLELCRRPFSELFHSKITVSLETTATRTSGGSSDTAISCLLPRSKIWLAHRQRFLLGVESLLLQGADPEDLRALRPKRWANSFLMDLGGNAFCVLQFTCVIISSFATRTT